jgi:hypothetical protein
MELGCSAERGRRAEPRRGGISVLCGGISRIIRRLSMLARRSLAQTAISFSLADISYRSRYRDGWRHVCQVGGSRSQPRRAWCPVGGDRLDSPSQGRPVEGRHVPMEHRGLGSPDFGKDYVMRNGQRSEIGIRSGRSVRPIRPPADAIITPVIPFAERVTCTIADACGATGLGRTKLYELIGEGALHTTTIGRRRLVLVSSLLRLLRPDGITPS